MQGGKLFQTLIAEMGEAIKKPLGMIDDMGYVTGSSDITGIEDLIDDVLMLRHEAMTTFVLKGYTFMVSGLRGHPDIISFVRGTDEATRKDVLLLGIAIQNLRYFYDERYDKGNFIKNIILDNVLPGDILLKSKELHLPLDVRRIVYLIRTVADSDFTTADIIRNLFPDRSKDFIVNVDEDNIALVKELHPDYGPRELEDLAASIVDTLNSEAMLRVCIGMGKPTNNIKELARSYKEAQVALEVGKVFDNEKLIINYDNLGIGRLIYQLPTTLCEMFLAEVFKKETLDALDPETIYTIQKFFENNLNVSETSRQLYVHRNTLVYRLDKVEKLTGLDLRVFDHAIVFKVAMMVKKYLVSNPIKI